MRMKYLKLIPVLFLGIVLASCSNGKVEIKTQPQSVTVHAPEGATFKVEVSNPKNVASYEWVMVDIEGTEFTLDGVTAKTDTLVVPSTDVYINPAGFYCKITDKAGNVLTSEQGVLSTDNRWESKPVLYVGEYAIVPGETLNLAEVDLGDGTKLGSGTVEFAANGKDITFTDLDYDNSHSSCGIAMMPNVGVSMTHYKPETVDEYNVIFKGTNRIMNNYYDPDYNAAGIPFDFYLNGETKKPLVSFLGDGSLEITNGSIAIRVIGDLDVGIDVTIRQTTDNYGDGINAENLKVSPGTKLDLEVFGSALYTPGNMLLEGSDITVNMHAPHISMGTASKNIIQAGMSMVIDGTTLNVASYADPEICRSVMTLAGLFCNGDMWIQNGSKYTYRIGELKQGNELYTSNYQGIVASSLQVEDSELDISIDSPHIYSSFGIYAAENAEFINSKVKADIHTTGMAYGIAPELDFNADNSQIDVNVSAYDTFEVHDAFGIMCENAVFRFEDAERKVSVKAEDGIALGCNLGVFDEEKPEYTQNYRPEHVYMREGADCLTPDAVISTGYAAEEQNGDMFYRHLETYFSALDTSRPLDELVFGLK